MTTRSRTTGLPNTGSHKGLLLAAALLLGAGLATPVLADSTPSPAAPASGAANGSSGAGGSATTAPKPKKAKKSKKEKQGEQQFYDGYRKAYALIQSGAYAEGLTALRALHQDNHPDVANYIGYASRKLGRMDDAKLWYERALAADATHTRTWQYYGIWQLEQGNLLKAKDHLAKIASICGNTACKDYVSLQDAINGNITY